MGTPKKLILHPKKYVINVFLPLRPFSQYLGKKNFWGKKIIYLGLKKIN